MDLVPRQLHRYVVEVGGQSGLLEDLPVRGTGERAVLLLAVAAELQPAADFAVEVQQNVFAVLADDECRCRYVFGESGSPQPVGVRRQVAQVPLAQLFLNRVRRLPRCEDPDGVAV
jgi:hypothetical protein